MTTGAVIKEGFLLEIIDKIARSPNTIHKGHAYDVIIHTANEDLRPMFVEYVDTVRDYSNNVADYVVVRCTIPMGDFVKEIYPNIDNLEVTLTYKSVGKAVITKYKGIVLNKRDGVVTPSHNALSRAELNKLELFNIELQCLERYVERINMEVVSGVYRDICVKDVMLCELGDGIQRSLIGGKNDSELSIHLVEPDNPSLYKNLIIPADTKVLDLPTYLQQAGYGVYNGDIGTYIQRYGAKNKPYIFVYPLYNSKAFKTTKKKLQLYKTNTPAYDDTACSHIVDGDVVKVIAGSRSTVVNTADISQIDNGVTIRAGNPVQLLSCNVVTSDTKVYGSKDSNRETQQMYTPPDKSRKIKYVSNTANLYKERSIVVRDSMAVCQIYWNYPDMDLIYPGIPVSYTFLDTIRGVITLYGNVQSTAKSFNKANNMTTGIINIMVSKILT